MQEGSDSWFHDSETVLLSAASSGSNHFISLGLSLFPPSVKWDR